MHYAPNSSLVPWCDPKALLVMALVAPSPTTEIPGTALNAQILDGWTDPLERKRTKMRWLIRNLESFITPWILEKIKGVNQRNKVKSDSSHNPFIGILLVEVWVEVGVFNPLCLISELPRLCARRTNWLQELSSFYFGVTPSIAQDSFFTLFRNHSLVGVMGPYGF